ncbi:MAG TPA: helicase HerA-like domain-containing protein [Chitinophagales bacterium]|nr:helicase HerA-like domain-containing protein [Chitinophagales bacterium]
MAVDKQKFIESVQRDYEFGAPHITVGAAMLNGETLAGQLVNIPLKTMNRHGLVAGATGTGKTKSLQVLAEGLSKNGVPCLLMDIKGDLSGLAQPAAPSDKVKERAAKIGIDYTPKGFPVEFLTLSHQPGARLRATVSEFGPVLLSRVLGLNDTQQGLVALMFKYADDKQLPLLDLADFKALLNYIQSEGKEEIAKTYGAVSTTSASTILRKVIELEQQDASLFFGEPSFDVNDLMRKDLNGHGVLSIIRLTDIQDKPKLFSTFMLSLLAEVYNTLPEAGDLDKPKLCIFIDEAHLIFDEASKELLNQLETTIKLIRSKGVGIFFITQSPADIPSDILGQLGLKIQHALRAFTANDRKAIKLAAENFPLTEFYKTNDLLLSLGIGEALVTALSEKGTPTLLTATLMAPPSSRMDVLTEPELQQAVSQSAIATKYNAVVDRRSAYEMLQEKIKSANDNESDSTAERKTARTQKEERSTFEQILKSPVARSIGVAVAGALTRGLLGSLGVKTRRTTTRRR